MYAIYGHPFNSMIGFVVENIEAVSIDSTQ